MKQLLADFGSSHVWQMDDFFANGTSWGATPPAASRWESCGANSNARPSGGEGGEIVDADDAVGAMWAQLQSTEAELRATQEALGSRRMLLELLQAFPD